MGKVQAKQGDQLLLISKTKIALHQLFHMSRGDCQVFLESPAIRRACNFDFQQVHLVEMGGMVWSMLGMKTLFLLYIMVQQVAVWIIQAGQQNIKAHQVPTLIEFLH